jgi:drug/metabolite transporter (DMT)-like permease
MGVSNAKMSGAISVATSALSFATLGLFARQLAIEGLSPAAALFMRFGLAAAFLFILLSFGTQAKANIKEVSICILLGVFGYTIQAGLFFVSLQRIPIGVASLLLFMNPTLVI